MLKFFASLGLPAKTWPDLMVLGLLNLGPTSLPGTGIAKVVWLAAINAVTRARTNFMVMVGRGSNGKCGQVED